MSRSSRFAPTVCALLGALANVGSGTAAPAKSPTQVHVALDVGDVNDPVLQGSSIARSPGGTRLYVADAPNRALYVVASMEAGVVVRNKSVRIALPGAPAQIVAFADRVLVTVRDPSMLIVFHADADAGVVEERRVALADDAWGVTLTPDHQTAIVSSAWAHRASAIDLSKWALRWTVDVPREPRAIAVRGDGKEAYVSHLTSSRVTTIEELDGEKPIVRAADLSVAPLAGKNQNLEASLGWSLSVSVDGTRLFAPRQALGPGLDPWNGLFTIDVLSTTIDRSLVPSPEYAILAVHPLPDSESHDADLHAVAAQQAEKVDVPRASVFRARTRTLLVASEGSARIVEYDGRSLAPALQPLREYSISSCSAPDGIALSVDESVAYVHCAGSFTLARVALHDATQVQPWVSVASADPIKTISRYADDPLSGLAAKGRLLFTEAIDNDVSGGFSCSGCHPEGRDDGHVWALTDTSRVDVSPYGGNSLQPHALVSGTGVPEATAVPRQTPMLAGRVSAKGPYGWNAEAATLVTRVEEGMRLHRWFFAHSESEPMPPEITTKAAELAAFLRLGLVPPPSSGGALDALATKGKEIFEGKARCAGCHATGDAASPMDPQHVKGLGAPTLWFGDETTTAFKVPTLRFVGGTAPYYHDGSAKTLEQLIDEDHDRMGHTSDLDAEERVALVAYLRSL